MQITADQCRAARSLLNWTQDQLATNASVSRATIADFESNTRQPMKNNLRSIADRANFATDEEFGKAIIDILHMVLTTAERFAPTDIRDGKLIITYDMLQSN